MFNRFIKRSLPSLARSITHIHKPGDGCIRHVTLIPGAGIGPELTRSVQRVFEVANCPINWDIIDNFSFNRTECREKLKKNPTILLGIVKSGAEDSKYVANYPLYKYLDLYASVMHAYPIPGIETRHKKFDMVIIRENTEGEYSGVEHEVSSGIVESLKIMTKKSCSRIAEYAFEFAFMTGRQKVTAVHKANIMKLADGLFLDQTREIAKRYPNIKYEEMIIDNCSMQLVKNPAQFDVMVMPNFYGAIVQNIAAGIQGGVGITAGAGIGKDFQIFAQGSRHSGLDIAGKGIANPSGIMFSSILMLRSLGLPHFADLIDSALTQVIAEKKVRTPDIGGKSTNLEFTEAVCENIIARTCRRF